MNTFAQCKVLVIGLRHPCNLLGSTTALPYVLHIQALILHCVVFIFDKLDNIWNREPH